MSKYDLEKYIGRIIGPCEVTEENRIKAVRRIFELCRKHERYTEVARILDVPPKCVRQVMSLWKDTEIINDSAINSHLEHSDARTSITFKGDADTERLLQERKPQQNLAKQAEKRIFLAKELYDGLKNLELVGKKMSITRERVRQLLVRGVQRGLFAEVPSSKEAKFKKLCDIIPRQKLIDALFRWGSIRHASRELASIVKISKGKLIELAKFYEIDVDQVVSAGRRNKVVQRYYFAVSQLGFHPTETILCKMRAYRNLSAQIRRWWDSFDNFRKEYNVPISSKGSPLFRHNHRESEKFRVEQNKRRKQQQRQRIDRLFSYISGKRGLVTSKEIAKDLDLGQTALYTYLSILVKENKVYQTKIGRRVYYSSRPNPEDASSFYAKENLSHHPSL